MPLTRGTRLGVYEITAAIGVGGMGEVFRARDTKLNRDVALKVLPNTFAADPERLARFEREAQVLAALDHPNIGAIYGFEDSDGVRALVLQLVEGPTLADRIAQGPIAVDEAIPIARQIAEALEAAHEQGIIHRDLKPANVKVRDDGTVKVLDFGLAKMLEGPSEAGHHVRSTATMSPTITTPAMTMAGVILGTAAYMSPEQAKGLPADHRSDVFSFGCVLYEMLTGRQAFQGDAAAEVLASILLHEPDFTAWPATLNPRLQELVKRCLGKAPKRRWQAIGDLRAELETVAAIPHMQPTPDARERRLGLKYAVVVATAASAAAAIGVRVGMRMNRSMAPDPVRLSIPLGNGQRFTSGAGRHIDVSPDGKQIVYVANAASGSSFNTQLYVRAMSQFEERPLTATQGIAGTGIAYPVFSPDGLDIVFNAFNANGERALKRVATRGGPATVLLTPSVPAGISWGADGILIGGTRTIQRVNPEGGAPETLVTLSADEIAFQPEMLPGARAVMFTLMHNASAVDLTTARVVVQPLPSGARKTVAEGASDARYLPTGHVVYAVGGVLYARQFSLERLEPSGPPVPLVEGVERGIGNFTRATAQYAVSPTGALIYIPGPATSGAQLRGLISIDRQGKSTPLRVPSALYESPRISPDGSRLAIVINAGEQANVYVHDLAGGRMLRQLTFDGRSRFPIWSPDGKRIVFQSGREGDLGIWWQPADGSGAAERLTKAEKGSAQIPESFLPRTRTFSFSVLKSPDTVTLEIFSLDSWKAEPFSDVRSTAPLDSVFSPDGHWIAYTVRGKEAGAGAVANVWAQAVPPTGGKYLISTPGGHHPQWSPDGRRLLYFAGVPLVSVPVTTSGGVEVGDPERIPGGFDSNTSPESGRNHDISPDGSFVIAALPPVATMNSPSGAQRIEVVLNWIEELKRLAPTK